MADDEQLQLLREIARWTREAALPATRTRIIEILDTDDKLRVYDAMSTGSESIRGLERATGVDRRSIASWEKEWVAKGIIDSDSAQPKASFGLRDLGVEVPDGPAKPKKGTTA